MTPYNQLKKLIRLALRNSEAALVSPEKKIPQGVSAWSSTYKFDYPKGKVTITLLVDTIREETPTHKKSNPTTLPHSN